MTSSPTTTAATTATVPRGSAAMSTFVQLDKSASFQIQQRPKPPMFENKYEEREYLKGRLAATFRIFAKYGFDDGIEGHVTLRDPVEPDTFWVNPLGVPFARMKRSDLVQADHEGNVVAGGPVRLINKAAYFIHAAIHKEHPNVHCAAHCHSIYGRTFCAFGKHLDMTTQNACVFYNDHSVYQQYNGIVMSHDEGSRVAKSLGQSKALLMQHHGPLTVGATVEATAFWFTVLEKVCHSQLMIDSISAGSGSTVKTISDEEAAAAYKILGSPLAGWFAAQPMFEVVHQETNGEYLG